MLYLVLPFPATLLSIGTCCHRHELARWEVQSDAEGKDSAPASAKLHTRSKSRPSCCNRYEYIICAYIYSIYDTRIYIYRYGYIHVLIVLIVAYCCYCAANITMLKYPNSYMVWFGILDENHMEQIWIRIVERLHLCTFHREKVSHLFAPASSKIPSAISQARLSQLCCANRGLCEARRCGKYQRAGQPRNQPNLKMLKCPTIAIHCLLCGVLDLVGFSDRSSGRWRCVGESCRSWHSCLPTLVSAWLKWSYSATQVR